MEQRAYISRKQLAHDLGMRIRGKPYSVVTLAVWERDKYGPPVTRIGRDVVYAVESVEKWLVSQERTSPSSVNNLKGRG